MLNTNLTPDYSGVNPDYKVTTPELHDFGSNTTRRILMPRRGAYYSDSIVIREVNTNRILVKDVDYTPSIIEQDATITSGKPVVCYVVIHNHVLNPIEILEYQFVGGEFSLMPELLADVTAMLTDESNEISYNNLIGKPEFGFVPSFHEHGEDNTFNWQYIIESLDRLNHAVTVKHEATHDLLRSKIETSRDQVDVYLQPIIDDLSAHIARRDNPHNVTPAQAGTHSKTQVNNLLNGYHNLGDTVANATLFNGKNLEALRTDAKNLVPTANFPNGVFAPDRLGPNNGSGTRILTSTGWRLVSQLGLIANVIYFGNSTLDHVRTTLASSPVGTKASFLTYYRVGAFWYGNGAFGDIYGYYREIVRKIDSANNWQRVGG